MDKKTIWYCHPTAGSPNEGMSYRPYYLAKYWQEAGHQPYVISSSYHHLLHAPKIQKQTINHLQIEGVNYIRLKTPHYQHNGIKRMISMLTYALQFTKQQKKLLHITGKPDAIIVSSTHPFHYLSLYPIAKKHQIPLIFEVRDLWPSSLIELLKLNPWHPLVIFLNLIEKHAYKHAKYVVSLLADAKPYMVSQGLTPSKFVYIPNGTDCSSQTEVENLPDALKNKIKDLKDKQQFLIGYAGSLGVPNAMEHFIHAMEMLQKSTPHIQALLVGKGHQKEELMHYCQTHHIHNVHFFDPIPKLQVHHFLKKMDLLYLGWQDTKLYQYGVSPNKIFDYMLAGRPILESGGAPTSLVELAGCGKMCPSSRPELIAKHLIVISELSKDELAYFGHNGQTYVQKNHHYLELSKKYTNVLC
ncbi:MAG: glycosyltransferase WbuB [Gammaproteobacteria bacterium]|nr:glycosyltransferase WbuB [Gammaproteobacteria bacterium]